MNVCPECGGGWQRLHSDDETLVCDTCPARLVDGVLTEQRDCGCVIRHESEHAMAYAATCQDHRILWDLMFLHVWGGHEDCCDRQPLTDVVEKYGRQAVLGAFQRHDPRRCSYIHGALEVLGL